MCPETEVIRIRFPDLPLPEFMAGNVKPLTDVEGTRGKEEKEEGEARVGRWEPDARRRTCSKEENEKGEGRPGQRGAGGA